MSALSVLQWLSQQYPEYDIAQDGIAKPSTRKIFCPTNLERIGMAQQHDGEQKRSGGDGSPLTSLRDAKLSILKMADTMVNVVKSISPKRRKEL